MLAERAAAWHMCEYCHKCSYTLCTCASDINNNFMNFNLQYASMPDNHLTYTAKTTDKQERMLFRTHNAVIARHESHAFFQTACTWKEDNHRMVVCLLKVRRQS